MVELDALIESAQKARVRALTFRTSVGIAFETYDGKVYSGFNLETYGHKGEHAEEMGLYRMLADGYMGTDIRRMVEVFQSAEHTDAEIFPACMTCWARLWQFTHPYLEIVVVNTAGMVLWRGTLGSLFDSQKAMGLDIYPSLKIRLAKPLLNFRARLPLAPELRNLYNSDAAFRQYCEEVLHVPRDT